MHIFPIESIEIQITYKVCFLYLRVFDVYQFKFSLLGIIKNMYVKLLSVIVLHAAEAIFVSGSSMYVTKKPQQNAISRTFGCIFVSIVHIKRVLIIIPKLNTETINSTFGFQVRIMQEDIVVCPVQRPLAGQRQRTVHRLRNIRHQSCPGRDQRVHGVSSVLVSKRTTGIWYMFTVIIGGGGVNFFLL